MILLEQMLSLLSFWLIRNIEVLPGCLPTKPPSGNLPCETPISNLSHSTLSSFTRTALVLILTFGHNYANTSPILMVQRPATFHILSLWPSKKRLTSHSHSLSALSSIVNWQTQTQTYLCNYVTQVWISRLDGFRYMVMVSPRAVN